MKHPYADILIAVAEGKEIQWKTPAHLWANTAPEVVLECIHKKLWSPERFRVKPTTIVINGVECEAPTLGYHTIIIQVNAINGATKHVAWDTKEARDAAYAALIKPFGEVV